MNRSEDGPHIPQRGSPPDTSDRGEPVSIALGARTLAGDLAIPAESQGLVLFAHGSGSSRHSPRNQYVARRLRAGRLATLLLDLLTPGEEAIDRGTTQLRFDISLLAERLSGAIHWLASQSATRSLPLGLFGASTGAAAALVAAAQHPYAVRAIVSRGGRPDLAGATLAKVRAPTLLIVGGRDPTVLALNRDALERLLTPKRLMVVPAATHLFEEPGALDIVADLAREWFTRYLTS